MDWLEFLKYAQGISGPVAESAPAHETPRPRGRRRRVTPRERRLSPEEEIVARERERISREFAAQQIEWRAAYDEYLASPEWREKRNAAFAYYGYACTRCPSTGPILDIHHRHYRTFGFESVEDLDVLCRPCHDKEHGHRIR
jgi:5-methylcytosine-specific restriction endonuclease McrA